MWPLRIWSHLLKKSLIENFIFCTVRVIFRHPELFKPLTTNVLHHIETSQLICIANQLTGFIWWGNRGRYWVKRLKGKTHFYFLVHFAALTHFQPMVRFYTPWKHQKTGGSDVFGGYRSETLVEHGLM